MVLTIFKGLMLELMYPPLNGVDQSRGITTMGSNTGRRNWVTSFFFSIHSSVSGRAFTYLMD